MKTKQRNKLTMSRNVGFLLQALLSLFLFCFSSSLTPLTICPRRDLSQDLLILNSDGCVS